MKCGVAGFCDERAYWTNPARVAWIYGTHPVGPSDAGCPFGRQCLPPNGYAVSESMSISLSVDSAGNLFVVWADFRDNTNQACTGDANQARPPCDNDVFYAYSTDGGATWSDPATITPRSDPRFGETAQWAPWSAMAPNGHLWVAFYDRSFGNCEFNGCNDVSAAEITNPASSSPTYRYYRVTTSSMPNLTAQANPIEAGFMGDRMRIETDSQSRAHIAWTDTPAPFGVRARGGRVLRADSSAADRPTAASATPSAATAATSATASSATTTATATCACQAPGALPSAEGGRPTVGDVEDPHPSRALLSPRSSPGARESGRESRLAEPARRCGPGPAVSGFAWPSDAASRLELHHLDQSGAWCENRVECSGGEVRFRERGDK